VNRARFVEPARQELLAEVAYYQNIRTDLGVRFLAFPMTGSPAAKGTRCVFLKDFPFALVYRPDDQGIIVFSLAHHSRRPGYWRKRMDDR
jgi:hypothetical protein